MSPNPPPIYAWVCPLPGEGIMAAVVPETGVMPMVTLKEETARGPMAEVARTIAQMTGRPLQLVRWTLPEILEAIDV